jgi:ubiquitin carboxyl-terminal hydrolase L3
MIPQPVGAVMLLYAIKEHNKTSRDNLAEKPEDLDKDVWYMKQTIQNACGTVGILNALANVSENIKDMALTDEPSALKNFFESTSTGTTSSLEKARRLESNDEIAQLHHAIAAVPITLSVSPSLALGLSSTHVGDIINTHYVTFVHVNGGLYELDGRKPNPIRHCNTTVVRLLYDACQVIQKDFLDPDPHEERLVIQVLCPNVPVPVI